MAVRKEKDGSWTADFRYLDLIENKVKRYKKRGFKLKSEAVSFINNFNNVNHVSNGITFRTLFLEKLKNSEANKYTTDSNKVFAEKYLKRLMDREYGKITKSEFLNWRTIIDGYDIATSSKNRLIYTIRSTCRFAYNIYDLEDNSKMLKKIKPRFDEQKEIEVWTIEEFTKFIECVDQFVYAVFFRLLFFTGMRKGEAKALFKSDFKNGNITINKSMRRDADSLSFTKNKASERIIKVDSGTDELLALLQKEEGKFLFGDCEPITNTTIQRVFSRAIKKANVKKIRIHDLRHSHATILINSGVNIVAVSRRLGHKDINVTLQVYTHLLQKTEDDMMNKIESGAKMVPNNFEHIKNADKQASIEHMAPPARIELTIVP